MNEGEKISSPLVGVSRRIGEREFSDLSFRAAVIVIGQKRSVMSVVVDGVFRAVGA